MGKKVKSSKRKARENDENSVLSNKIAEDVKDGNDSVFDPNEPTMAEKLESLELLEKTEGSKEDIIVASEESKPPSVDSVNILLKQLLNADDRARLMECLLIKDDKVITNSIELLNPSDVLKFLQALIPIIQLRGAVMARALPWLKSLLLQHSSIIMSQEASLAALNTLFQLIESRVSTFDQSLQLSSCLDLLYTETIDDDEEEETDVVTPVIFEDTDGSEDEGSEDSMDVESDKDVEEPVAHSDISDDEMFGEIISD